VLTRHLPCVVLAAAALIGGGVTAADAAPGQPYPVLVEREGLRVFGPTAGSQWGRCPKGALPLRRSHLETAERAALLLVSALAKRGWYDGIDTRGARARAARLRTAVWTRWGLAKSTCGSAIVPRTLAVAVGFPRVNWSASLSSSTFFASRVGRGWIFWHQAH
jgi:hypothetical protein